MNDKFAKLLEKKKKEGKTLNPLERDAKMSVMNDMKQMASDEMGDRLKGLKKVTVASDSAPGLSEDLDKAKELLGDHDQEDPDMEKLEEETGEDLDHDNEEGEPLEHQEQVLGHEDGQEEHEDADLSPEEIEQKIQKLMLLKKSKM